MSTISVVTVTYNNAQGLKQTLESLAALSVPPLEVLVIDGGSTDATAEVISEFSARLPIRFQSEPDRGIYDAMNKGLGLVRGELIHYLNGGDRVWGEPYLGVDGPSLMPVRIVDELGRHLFDDFPKFGGFGYCHQGILFPFGHAAYRTDLRIAADLDLVIQLFPGGLGQLPVITSGGAAYGLGGLSSTASGREREARRVLWQRLPALRAMVMIGMLTLKACVPSSLRRALVHYLAPR
jgi:glycosyltransferase involved in cell wall biosynthesis